LQSAIERVEAALDRCRAEELEKRTGVYRAIFGDLLPLFDAEYRRLKQSLAALDFADLEWSAREVLESSEETRRRGSGRFRHVFLDEFQDTNPLQSAIVDRLRGGRSFFVVGDSQQSIYGFRDADAGILADFRERAQSQGGHIVLRENFR